MATLADYFRGGWRFTRTIWEGGEQAQAQASGEGRFDDGDLAAQLIYREHGALRMLAAPPGARAIPFTRVFDYRFNPTDVEVLFADGERVGQPYQRYALRGNLLAPAGDHLCGPDCYNAAYTLDDAGRFTMETFINGPKKRTRVLTVYVRDRGQG
ncbi:MAG: hypothetical protein GAK35_00622 [Herbaspirillum frisingense]|uniref:DUF6314 domain-containing protein n=1 Tax=Herbaspirillum frisingense TaxID=92645 RepID=A0A7V8FZH3_9BURK|nr:MAG: hypothetical protein GAK35_00622 [Herbaspirillum frisingense]